MCGQKVEKKKMLVLESVGANKKSCSRNLINSQETHLYVTAPEENWILFFM